MSTLFIADLHLDKDSPEITDTFLNFLENTAVKAERLYILGDLFEAWLGDDDTTPFNEMIIQALRKAADAGVKCYFIHGNRDFAIGKVFAQKANCELLPEHTVIDLYGTPTLIMHGDTLCTADQEYQNYRKKIRNPSFMNFFSKTPLWVRKLLGFYLRQKSKKRTNRKSTDIMDVTPEEIPKIMHETGAKLLIHGHTHRPSLHYFKLNGDMVTRIVLSDWHKSGNVLICTPNRSQRLVYF